MFCVASEGEADPEDRGCRKADLYFYQECFRRPEVPVPKRFKQPTGENLLGIRWQRWIRW